MYRCGEEAATRGNPSSHNIISLPYQTQHATSTRERKRARAPPATFTSSSPPSWHRISSFDAPTDPLLPKESRHAYQSDSGPRREKTRTRAIRAVVALLHTHSHSDYRPSSSNLRFISLQPRFVYLENTSCLCFAVTRWRNNVQLLISNKRCSVAAAATCWWPVWLMAPVDCLVRPPKRQRWSRN